MVLTRNSVMAKGDRSIIEGVQCRRRLIGKPGTNPGTIGVHPSDQGAPIVTGTSPPVARPTFSAALSCKISAPSGSTRRWRSSDSAGFIKIVDFLELVSIFRQIGFDGFVFRPHN